MRFAEPSFLLLVWLVPVLAAFYLWSFRRREQLLQAFARVEMLARLLPQVSRSRQRVRAALLTSAVVFALLALLRPQWGFHWEELKREGVDIMVAVDVSQSMLAADVKPNRLKRAVKELEDLVARLEGDRVGLIAFSGNAFMQCPLTLDYGAFQMFLEYLSPDLIPVPGTSLGQAILLAIEGFIQQSSTSRALILITDGEDHEGEPLEAAKKAKEAGVKIFVIGIGAEEGAPIPSPDGQGFIKDESGQLVLSKLDEVTLQKIAVETGGAYVRSTTGEMDLQRIYDQGIRQSLEAHELTSTRQKRFEERFQWPLVVAFLLVILEAFISERGRRRVLSGLVLVLACSAAGSAQAQVLGDRNVRGGVAAYEKGDYETALQKFTDATVERPDDPLLDYNLGNAYYKTRRYPEAAQAYQKVLLRSGDARLKERAWYNLGNTQYRQGTLEEAVKSYQEALKLDPQDEDARRNLELTKREILRRKEAAQKQQEKQEQQKQSQEQQKQSQGEQEQGGQGKPEEQPDAQKQAQQQGQGEKKPEPGEKQGQQQGQDSSPGQGEQKQAGETGPQKGQDAQKTQAQAAKEGDQSQGQAGQQAQALKPGQLTKEEAQRLLNQVRDSQPVAQPMQRARQGGRAGAPGGKPW